MTWAMCCALAFAMTGIVACSSTVWLAEWPEAPSAASPISNVLVFGIGDVEKTKVFEDTFVSRLAAHGVSATASHTVFGLGEEIPEETVTETIKKNGYDAVLVTHLIGVEKTEESRSRWRANFRQSYDVYKQAYTTVRAPEKKVIGVQVRLETKLFNVTAKKFAWGGLVEVRDPASAEEAIQAKIDATITKLVDNGFVGAAP